MHEGAPSRELSGSAGEIAGGGAMNEKFNTAGISGLDCVVCFRPGALKRQARSDTLECTECYTRFSLTRGDGATTRDTLTRLAAPEPLRPLTFEEMDRVRGGVA
jgi:hypothetical protein